MSSAALLAAEAAAFLTLSVVVLLVCEKFKSPEPEKGSAGSGDAAKGARGEGKGESQVHSDGEGTSTRKPRRQPSVESLQSRQIREWRKWAQKCINLGLIVTSALMIWKGLMVVSGCESPVVVVLSGSMEPGFWRGDILFLWLGSSPFRVGEIILFKNEGHDVPIVHRIIKVHQKADGTTDLLTKGDNNVDDDRGIYPPGQRWLNEKFIVGRAVGYLPSVGYVTLVMNDYPFFKFALLGALGVMSLMSPKQ
jgi:signal peptidase